MGDPMVGIEIRDRYRIDEALGRGGMGRVYVATDRELGRRIAVKFLREELNDDVARERFRREARSAAALSHPHACRLYEVGDHHGEIFLVMELLDGELLSERIERGRLPMAEAVEVALPLMSAVAALHGLGLIHRDLKPSNVMLTNQGVKLLDFGLARHTGNDAAVTAPSLTMAGAVAGTLRYMAPEQVTGDPVDERTDIFALGVMLYEMLTGRIPFEAETNVDWLKAVMHDEPRALGDPALAALEPVVQRALQRRLTARFSSVAEMAGALEMATFAGVEPVPASTQARGNVLVVLPFRALQEDAEIGFLQHGIPEAVTAGLASGTRWRMVSNRSALRFDDTTDPAVIGRELRADHLVFGTFLRGGARVRVSVQLLAAADSSVVWSHTAEYPFDDPLALQAAISDDAVAGLAQVPAAPLAADDGLAHPAPAPATFVT